MLAAPRTVGSSRLTQLRGLPHLARRAALWQHLVHRFVRLTPLMPDISSASHRGVARLRSIALLGALLVLAACAPRGAETGPLPGLAQYAGQEVASVDYVGDLELSRDSLRQVTVTRRSRCRLLFLPICIPGTRIGYDPYFLDLNVLSQDVARLQLLYRDHGYYGTQVVPTVDPADQERIDVEFHIRPGRLVRLTALEIEGTEDIVPMERLLERVPLEEGEPFRRRDFLASADTIRAAMLREGYAFADVLRNFAIDTVAGVADVHFQALPGPLVEVDTILFLGGERLGERTARQQLTFDEGDVLRATALNQSQRNLYRLGFISFASVEIAADTLQRDADPSNATVLVRIVENPRYMVDATAGYGTVDCGRTTARWVDRNFRGGARRLEVSGSLSKIGVGSPLATGLGRSLCPALADDPFSESLNYRLAADFEQPRLFAPGTRATVRAHVERISEVNAFLRESVGTQTAVTYDLTEVSTLSGVLDVERGRTEADAIVFCLSFDVCTPEAREPLERTRWSNAISGAYIRDRTDVVGTAIRGNRLRTTATWATGLLGSDDRFLRLVGEGAAYREVREDWVVAGFLRAGTFLEGRVGPVGGFIPPAQRFYAGGPNSVRGFARNALGPRAFVATVEEMPPEEDLPGFDPIDADTLTVSAIGGTRTLVASAELRMPSPLFSHLLRTAVFVDAGQVWASGQAPGVTNAPIRVTPGVGIRFATPVGPIRLDLAYNPYQPEPGPLYVGDRETGVLLLADPMFQPPERRGIIDRLRLHFAVGQAF
jgi:outer membrane protein assembly complex protein YaeT